MPKNLPDRIADELLARVFTGEYAAGERLPAERALCAELGVDRTSLRMALRQLSRMNVVRSVRGSGITVLDYRAHAGIDFLAAPLEVPGLELGGAFLLEALGHWERALPWVVSSALSRATPAELAELTARLDAQIDALEAGEDLDRVAAMAVDMQDHVVERLGDVTLRLVSKSTRGLRRALTRLHFELNDARELLTRERALLEAAFAGAAPEDEVRAAHAAYLKAQHEALRAHLARLPPRPHRTSRWVPPRTDANRADASRAAPNRATPTRTAPKSADPKHTDSSRRSRS